MVRLYPGLSQVAESRRALAVQSAQVDAFRSVLPLVGRFACGSRVPATGLALVHRNEQITSDPTGPVLDGAFTRTR